MGSMRVHPIFTARIDFDGISREFEALLLQTKNLESMEKFGDIVVPLVRSVLKRYKHLSSRGNYIPGELAGLALHLCNCVESIMPDRFNFGVLIGREPTPVFFVRLKGGKRKSA